MTSLAGSVTSDNMIRPALFDACEKEAALIRRYNRDKQPELTFEFTRDPGLLHQYYRIRKDEYNAVYGTVDYPAEETETDRAGHIMVVRQGNFCVGGARLNIKTPRKSGLLPMEIDGFRIADHFPELRHPQASYCQVAGFSLLPEFRGLEVTNNMGRRIVNKCLAMNVTRLFAVCPILNARLYKKNFVAIGLKDPQIFYNIELPYYSELKEMGTLYLFTIAINKLPAENPLNYIGVEEDKVYYERHKAAFFNSTVQIDRTNFASV